MSMVINIFVYTYACIYMMTQWEFRKEKQIKWSEILGKAQVYICMYVYIHVYFFNKYF